MGSIAETLNFPKENAMRDPRSPETPPDCEAGTPVVQGTL